MLSMSFNYNCFLLKYARKLFIVVIIWFPFARQAKMKLSGAAGVENVWEMGKESALFAIQ